MHFVYVRASAYPLWHLFLKQHSHVYENAFPFLTREVLSIMHFVYLQTFCISIVFNLKTMLIKMFGGIKVHYGQCGSGEYFR